MSVVLTVEDECFVSEYLGHVLAKAGYTVIAAADADEAIAILESRDDIRIVFTDINMPGSMDGLKLAAAVKDRWPPIELVIATGKGTPSKDEMPPGSLFSSQSHTVPSKLSPPSGTSPSVGLRYLSLETSAAIFVVGEKMSRRTLLPENFDINRED
jgi:two-component system, response regulator PdtaR